MSLSFLPNVLTVARIIAVIPSVVFMLLGHYGLALLVIALAGISDVLDGYLARRFGWQTQFGGWADPAADKLLMSACYITLAYLDILPLWMTGLVLSKDVIIVCGALSYRYFFGAFEAMPTLLSKITTLMQLLLIWIELVALLGLSLPQRGHAVLILCVALLTGMTLIQYAWIWSTKAWRQYQHRKMMA